MNEADEVNMSENESDFEYINKETGSGNESEESKKTVELHDLVADVIKIEDEINAEASNIVEISSHIISDQPLYLQPIPVEDVLDVRDDSMDEASSPIEELLTYDDGQKLEKEIEISAFCLEQIMPKTQSEVEMEESEESQSDSEHELLSEENSFHLLENNFQRKKVLSGESSDSEFDPFTQENKYKFTLLPKKIDNSITDDGVDSEFILDTENSGSLFLTESECILSDNDLNSKPIKLEGKLRESEMAKIITSAENVVSAILEDVLRQFDNNMIEDSDDIDKDHENNDIDSVNNSSPTASPTAEASTTSNAAAVTAVLEAEPCSSGLDTEAVCTTGGSYCEHDNPSQLPGQRYKTEINISALTNSDPTSDNSHPLEDAETQHIQETQCLTEIYSQDDTVLENVLTEEIAHPIESEVIDDDIKDQYLNHDGCSSSVNEDMTSSEVNEEDIDNSQLETVHDNFTTENKELSCDDEVTEVMSEEESNMAHSSSSVYDQNSSVKLSELKDWLDSKEKEVNDILSDDNDYEIDDLEQVTEILPRTETISDAQKDFNLQAEILKQLTESILAASQDISGKKNDNGKKDTEEMTATGEHILDSSSVLITPMTVKPNPNKKKHHDSEIKRKNIKSPLLRRKEIRNCINLHNACENSDVLNEIMGPALNFGSSSLSTTDSSDVFYEVDQQQKDNQSPAKFSDNLAILNHNNFNETKDNLVSTPVMIYE